MRKLKEKKKVVFQISSQNERLVPVSTVTCNTGPSTYTVTTARDDNEDTMKALALLSRTATYLQVVVHATAT